MTKKYPLGTWIYNPINEFTPAEVDRWHDMGLTETLTPRIVFGKDDVRSIIPYLDKAAEYGMKLIIYVTDMASGDYEENFRSVYLPLKGHKALGGFFTMDEPSTPEAFETVKKYLKIQQAVAPELTPYVNLQGSTHENEKVLCGRSYNEFLKAFVEETGVHVFCFDAYTQLIGNPTGIDNYFKDVKRQVEAAEYAGVDVIITPLCSGHLCFNVPAEEQMMWQLTTSAACGCKGAMWFRFYDRNVIPNYHGSPIDPYYNETEHYGMMRRAQRIFSDQFGDMFMKLKRKATYCFGRQLGEYPMFRDGDHELLNLRGYEDTIISFFEDERHVEYVALVNASMTYLAPWYFEYDEDKCSLTEIRMNETLEFPIHSSLNEDDQTYLYPGQMAMYRIDRK